MWDDFLTRAFLAGVGVAMASGPMGCFIVWRRMSYFGDTMAHSALLGVALAVFMDINLSLAVFMVTTLIALALLFLKHHSRITSDALLGVLSHGSLALGLVGLSLMPWVRTDLTSFLFGDILAVNGQDIITVYASLLVILPVLMIIFRPLFAATVSEDLAIAEMGKSGYANLVFTLLLALVVAVAMKIVGILLITALLIIPAVTARRFSSGPEIMTLLSSVLGIVSVLLGLVGSYELDTPAGPSIVVASLALFFLSFLLTRTKDGR